ncbi:hypothetical protein ACN20G_16730 [Streptomyces sp. BI20]|uniref:hypothetical protein n=1 Tax=Streptomyces sp. BI20 TaxID=3403460 RepID=UPI003C788497
MKLKRIAAVAAAAVVGPTVLMATPAMADEAPSAPVSTPDLPGADAQPAAEAPAPETPKTPEVKPGVPGPETGEAVKPAPEVPNAKPDTKPVAEAGKDKGKPGAEQSKLAKDPELSLHGVPKSFTPGKWSTIQVDIDNSKGKAHKKGYAVALVLGGNFNPDHMRAQISIDALGTGDEWEDLFIIPLEGEMGYAALIPVGSDELKKGEAFGVDVRLKFDKQAKKGAITLQAMGISLAEDAPDEPTAFSSVHKSRIGEKTSGGNNGGGNGGGETGGGNTGGGNQPDPNGGGSKPIVDNGGGNNSGNAGGGNGGTTTPGGELAETGADAASTWALGGAGIAVAMGVALVAGTGKRRRQTV